MYVRKRNYKRKRPYRKRSKAKTKQTVAIVKKVLHSQIENKQAFKSVSGIRVTTSMPTTLGTGMYSIIPNLVSSLSGDNSKVGQQVKPLSLKLGMNALISNVGGNSNNPVYFDLYVFSIKQIKDSSLFDDDGPANIAKFLRPSIAGVDTFYEGRVYNWFQNVNKDVINLIHRKRFKMSPTNIDGTPGSGFDGRWVDNYSQYSINYNLPLSKHVAKTLKYTNATDEQPNNCALFATLVCTRANADNNPENYTGGLCSFNSCLVYEDA